MRDPHGFACSHGVKPYVRCWKCEQEERDLARDDEMRQTLIDLTTAFNRMADSVDRVGESLRAK